jgi:hypothetical protein
MTHEVLKMASLSGASDSKARAALRFDHMCFYT